MAKAKVKVKARNGKSGTKIAETKIAISPTEEEPKGPRIYGASVKMTARIKTNSRGKPRRH